MNGSRRYGIFLCSNSGLEDKKREDIKLVVLKKQSIDRIEKSNQKELITVIVACYNIEKYIGRCLDSICNQTYQNLEILVTDDGSTDSSGKICDEFAEKDSRITVFHTENSGLGMARNYAMDRASGDYIAFVDGDDFIVPRMYEEMLSVIKKHDLDIAIAGYREVSDSAKLLEEDITKSLEQSFVCDIAVMDSGDMLKTLVEEDEKFIIQNCAWNKLYKRSAVSKLRFPNQLYEDIVYTTVLLSKMKKGAVICDKLYQYVVDRKDSIMNQGVRWEILTQQIPSYKERDRILISVGRQDLADIHDYMVYKKLLILYTLARRSKDREKKAKMCALGKEIKNSKERFDFIYSTPVSNPHQKLRTRLFLIHPLLFNIFTDINDTFILPYKNRQR